MKNVTGFDETPQGQLEYAEFLGQVLTNHTDKRRETALLWWGAEYAVVTNYAKLAGHALNSFFNTSEVALPIVKNFGHFGKVQHSASKSMSILSK